eukprot:scaffold4342_cov27-Tisochrysis_lutea.AAC.6
MRTATSTLSVGRTTVRSKYEPTISTCSGGCQLRLILGLTSSSCESSACETSGSASLRPRCQLSSAGSSASICVRSERSAGSSVLLCSGSASRTSSAVCSRKRFDL